MSEPVSAILTIWIYTIYGADTYIYINSIYWFLWIYTGSSKQPDMFFRPDTSSHFPRVVIESGWSESWPHLRSGIHLWFSGGPEVRYVILLKWSKISDLQVKGLVEVYHRNAAGAAVLLHREVSYRSISSLNAVSNESISNHEYSNYFRRLLQR